VKSMMDPMGLQLLVRLRNDDLRREAAAYRRADEVPAQRAAKPSQAPAWRGMVLAWLAAIIEHRKVGTRLESPGG
jgi:hypothetical protein